MNNNHSPSHLEEKYNNNYDISLLGGGLIIMIIISLSGGLVQI